MAASPRLAAGIGPCWPMPAGGIQFHGPRKEDPAEEATRLRGLHRTRQCHRETQRHVQVGSCSPLRLGQSCIQDDVSARHPTQRAPPRHWPGRGCNVCGAGSRRTAKPKNLFHRRICSRNPKSPCSAALNPETLLTKSKTISNAYLNFAQKCGSRARMQFRTNA
jgi:hypothetical protein